MHLIKLTKRNGKGMGDFLGTGITATQFRKYRSYVEAKLFVKKINISSQKEWRAYCKTGKKPNDIPMKLERTYKNEWKGWNDFLGKE